MGLDSAFLVVVDDVLARTESVELSTMNESSTKRMFIEPLLAALGWNMYDLTAVSSEYRVYDGTFLDYALLVAGKAVLFCEAKPTGKVLTDPRWVSQTINYANNEGVLWCVLTDGLRWRVYKANEPVTMDRKLAFEIDLSDLADPARRERALGLFECLTPAGAGDGQLAALGTQIFVDGRVRAALTAALEQPDRKFIDSLRTRLGTEARLSPADIKAALTRVSAPALLALNKVTVAGPARPERAPARGPVNLSPKSASTAARLRPAPGDAAGPPGDLAGLLRAGLLTAGESLFITVNEVTHEGHVGVDGWFQLSEDRRWKSASGAAKLAMGYGSWNGWEYWSVRRDGAVVSLAVLRNRLAAAP